MTKILRAGLPIVFASLLTTGPALATEVHTWVSSTGSGAACTRALPCATLQAAHDNTTRGGIISILDPNEFEPNGLTITKAITVRAEGVDGGAAEAVVFGGGSWVTVQAFYLDDVVTLEGLHFSGGGAVEFLSGAQLHIVRCVFTNGAGAGDAGIKFRPNGTSKLNVTDTVISNMGAGTGGGIVVNPQAGGTAQVALERVSVNGGAFGIAVDGSSSTGGINMTVADSMVANNSKDGIVATTSSGHAPIGVMVINTKSVNNDFGVRSIGPNVTVRVQNSQLTGNDNGLSFSGGAALLSAGNNVVEANTNNGAFSGQVTLK